MVEGTGPVPHLAEHAVLQHRSRRRRDAGGVRRAVDLPRAGAEVRRRPSGRAHPLRENLHSRAACRRLVHRRRRHRHVDGGGVFQASPLGQAAQFELLARLIEKEGLGQRDTLDFVCLIAGSTARLGYETGGRSPLMRQMVLHLDRQLEILLGCLKNAPGENAFNLVLAGAPGRPPAPAAETRARMAVPGESVAQAVDRALLSSGLGRVTRYLYPFLYLDTSGSFDPEPVRLTAGNAALEH